MMYQDPKTGRVQEVGDWEAVKLSILKNLGWRVVGQNGAQGTEANPEAPKAATPQAPPAGTAVETVEPAGPPAVTAVTVTAGPVTAGPEPEPVKRQTRGKAN